MQMLPLARHPFITVSKVRFVQEKIIDHLFRRELGLSFAQYMVLVFCALKPGITQECLAAMRNSTEAAVSRLVRALVRRGLIGLRRGAHDRRRHELRLTAAGTRELRRAQAIAGGEFARFLASVGSAERRAFERTLGKILANVIARAEALSIIKHEASFA